MPRETRNSKKDTNPKTAKPVSTKAPQNPVQRDDEVAPRPKRTIKPTLRLIESQDQSTPPTKSDKKAQKSKPKGEETKKTASSKKIKKPRTPSRVPIYRQVIALDDESEANDIYSLKKSDTNKPKRAPRKRPAQKGIAKKPSQPKKEKTSREPSESVKPTKEALPILSVVQCPENENLIDYFEEPNFDPVLEEVEVDNYHLETEVSTSKQSPHAAYLHRPKEYKTPSIPSRVASKVREECKVSTPRLDGIDAGSKFENKEVIYAGSYQAPPLAEMREKCFGFDDYDSEDNAEVSQGSIGAGSLSLSEISPVKRSSLLPPNQCLTMVGSPSIIGMSTTINFLEKSQLHTKPSRFVHPSKKPRTNRSALMSTKRKNTTSSAQPIPEVSNKENLKKSSKTDKKATVLKEMPQSLVQPNIEPVIEVSTEKPMNPSRPKTRQSLIYETVNQKKVFKTQKRPQPKTKPSSFLDDPDPDQDGPNDEKQSSFENQDALPEAFVNDEPPSKSSKTYSKFKKEEPMKLSKKASAVLNDWESQQSLHFSKIDEFDLIFEKD